MKYTARVIPGRGEGRKLGFPTLNLEIPPSFDSKQGVYAGWVWLADASGERQPAAFHYGSTPVFGIEKLSLETHVIGQDIPLPPAEISFELVKYLRPVLYFEALEGLAAQIRGDVRQTMEALKIV